MPTKTRRRAETRLLPAHIVGAIAVAATTDPRTVARVIAGLPTRAATRDRILHALRNRELAEGLTAQLERRS